MKPTIVAISGSLRTKSASNAVLAVAAHYLRPLAHFIIYNGLSDLPHFDDGLPNDQVINFRKLLAESDGVLLCSPEYAFGIPGSLKNAIDWTVSSGEFVHKPLALITAATGGEKAHAAWLQVFTALSATIDERSALLLSFIRSKMTNGDITDAATLEKVHMVLDGLLAQIAASRATEAS